MASGDEPVSLEQLKQYPVMTSWFAPGLLAKLLKRVVVSEMFGQYADRRLLVAALDPVKDEELTLRARQFFPGTPFADESQRPPTVFTPDQDGAIWIDFVADLGDGFDSTFAVASLLARDKLTADGHTLPRGQLLVMGGDEVYPNADPKFYHEQLINPYAWAWPDLSPKSLAGPPVYAIPGNHDWYDGLVLFLAYFTRKWPHTHLGSWRTWQRRSYFALQLTKTVWIWGMDAQLADDVDQPQKDYFDTIAKSMEPHSKIILCGPEPGWLYTLQNGNKSLSVIDNVAWSAVNTKHGLRIPLVLSGDTHHYSRYSGNDGTQFVTSGGGGAFLHPTHQLRSRVSLDGSIDNKTWLGGLVSELNLRTEPAAPHQECPVDACYPSRNDSIALLRGNFKFSRLNPGFCILLGVIYWLAAGLTTALRPDSYYLVPLLFCLGFWAYTKRQEGNSPKVAVVSVINGVLHACLALYATRLFAELNSHLPEFCGYHAPLAAAWLLEMGAVGALLGGYLFGAYLYVSSRWLDMNHNDAFSSMRLNTHKNFLRMRITDDEIKIYPIGLTTVPGRDDWQINKAKTSSNPSEYEPKSPLAPHLIEGPVTVKLQ